MEGRKEISGFQHTLFDKRFPGSIVSIHSNQKMKTRAARRSYISLDIYGLMQRTHSYFVQQHA